MSLSPLLLTADIFWVFFKISVMSFGGVFGVLPELERMVVLERNWVTHDQFIQSYVIAQFLPGPNVAMCPLIGYWVQGWSGFVSAFFGIYIGPLLVMGATYSFYRRFRDQDWLRRTELALRPFVLGLLTSSLLRFWWLQSEIEAAPWISRVYAALLTGVGIYLYQRKWLTGLKLIVWAGVVWWCVNIFHFHSHFLVLASEIRYDSQASEDEMKAWAALPLTLFFVSKDVNQNKVIYEARVASECVFEAKNPILTYWVLGDGTKEDLNIIEKALYSLRISELQPRKLVGEISALKRKSLNIPITVELEKTGSDCKTKVSTPHFSELQSVHLSKFRGPSPTRVSIIGLDEKGEPAESQLTID